MIVVDLFSTLHKTQGLLNNHRRKSGWTVGDYFQVLVKVYHNFVSTPIVEDALDNYLYTIVLGVIHVENIHALS